MSNAACGDMPARHRVVIVGGGAGGLELATRLGDRLGHRIHVTLIDRERVHVWKPKLHEIAAGSMDMAQHEVDYLAQAHWHRFRYRIGAMIGLDRGRREVHVAASYDEAGQRLRNWHSRPGADVLERQIAGVARAPAPSGEHDTSPPPFHRGGGVR